MGGELVQPGYRAFVTRVLGDEGRAWLAQLPGVLEELGTRWRLELGDELPGGLLSCVRAATLEDGAAAILKIGAWPRTHDEIRALRVWSGRGAPRLIAADESLRALLLERIAPGDHPGDAQADAVATVLAAIHASSPAGFPTLGATVHRRIDNAVRDGRASAQKADWARTRADELERNAPAPVLVHGDFDERNLLRCHLRGLCAIDPLPCAGDPCYDAAYWVHGNRRPGRRARLDAIVAATGLPRKRVRDWAAIIGVHG